MRIGNMRQRITIQKESRGGDSGGGFEENWTDVATRWAGVRPVTGRERETGMQLEAQVTHIVTMRYLDGLNPGMRILLKGRALNIRRVLNLEERNRWMELQCEEGVAT